MIEQTVQTQRNETPRSQYILHYGSASACGPRPYNQDLVAVARYQAQGGREFTVAAVADGMGGEAGGEEAAREALNTAFSVFFENVLLCLQQNVEAPLEEVVRKCVQLANQQVCRCADASEDYKGMGTTLTFAVLDGLHLYLANVGDSRCYRRRGAEWEQLTRDDSVIQTFVDTGWLTPEQAEEHPRNHLLSRVIGKPSDTDNLEVTTLALEPGDFLLLCSDGFWKEGRKHLETLNGVHGSGHPDLTALANELVEGAVADGADDNVTVALLWLQPIDEEKTNGQ